MFGNKSKAKDENEDIEEIDDLISDSSRTTQYRKPSVAQYSQYYRESTMEGILCSLQTIIKAVFIYIF